MWGRGLIDGSDRRRDVKELNFILCVCTRKGAIQCGGDRSFRVFFGNLVGFALKLRRFDEIRVHNGNGGI